MSNIIYLFLFFIIYSFLGWCCEVVYCYICDRKLVNRGFLNGPICPVYGVGALLVIFFLRDFQDKVILLFLMGVLVTSILEYITGYLLEVIFKTKWWDYSNKKLNIHGRVCLWNSTLFGILSVVLIEVINKEITNLISVVPLIVIIIVSCIFFIIFISDCITTVVTMVKLNSRLMAFIKIVKQLNEMNVKLKNFDSDEWDSLILKFRSKNSEEETIQVLMELREKINKISKKTALQRRILRAFPNMEHKKEHEYFNDLRNIIKNKIIKK